MGVDSQHPLYDEHEPDWRQMRDTYRGERVIKAAGVKYLPPTSGMIADGMTQAQQAGFQAYDAYRKRSRFPDSVREAVEALLGVMHHKSATIELPEKMEFMRGDATARGESLQMLLRRINEQQLIAGRLGLLADVAETGERADLPYVAVYEAEDIINWDEGRSDGIEVQNLNFASINETEPERIADFEWEDQQKYRVLLLTADESDEAAVAAAQGTNARGPGDSGEEPVKNLPEGEGVYRMGVFRENNVSFTPSRMITPKIKGKELNKIPFVFVNTKDVVPEPDDPPLLGLSNLSLAIYRGEADYRQALFMQGQDTLVVIGGASDDVHRVGAGASINLPVQGDAKYIGVDSMGLSEMRQALENDYDRAGQKGGQLLDNVGGDKESGEALRVRVAAKTATLNQVALTGGFGLESILKTIAVWMRADPEKVVVIPNTDFADDRMSGKQLMELMAAKQLGAPLALESIHLAMQEQGITDFKFEEELKKIEEERATAAMLAPIGSTDEDGPEDDPEPDEEDEEEELEADATRTAAQADEDEEE